MSDASLDAATVELTRAAMEISRRHKLGAVGLVSILADVIHKIANAYGKASERAQEEQPMTPAAAAKISTFGVAIGEPDQSDPWLYLFRLNDRRYFRFLGSKIEPIPSVKYLPFCTWSPAAAECTAAVTISEAKPCELDAWTATQNSPFLIAVNTDAKGRPIYWVEQASKYIIRGRVNWYSSDNRPGDCPELGWKPVENSDVAGIVSEKARTL